MPTPVRTPSPQGLSAPAPASQPPPSRAPSWRAVTLPAMVAAGAAGSLALLGAVSPYTAGRYPLCPTFALTGLYCPGCGSLRALHDLAQLDVLAAWGMNPLAVLALPLLAALWFGWLRRRVTGRPRRWLAPPWLMRGLLVLLVAFTVARNVPALAPWLAPG